MHNKPHSLETRIKISKIPSIVTNFKDGRANYSSVHKWIVRWYGKANKCENPMCSKKSKMFDWANIAPTYEKNIKNFRQLCRSCHTKIDGHCFQKGHKYLSKKK
jgi:hypothetical protein